MEKFEEFVNNAISKRCSDIFVLPFGDHFRIMDCIKGKKKVVTELSAKEGQQMIAYFKYRGNMTVSEHRRPQIGALKWKENSGEVVDLRLSTVGDYQARESLVIRLIYSLSAIKYQVAFPQQWDELEQLVLQRGLILFARPMGSGKTTTMYRLAKKLAVEELVMTIEDPVEIEENDFLQLQVNNTAGMGYQELLKVGLRHRPDNFIIGEIRDPQTAKMAVQAALSGHLVLATVHATNAYGAIARMRQLGVESYYLQQVLTGICYQRLLPLKQSSAVLFELLANNDGFQITEEGHRGMSDEWQQRLKQLLQEEQITLATYEKFQNG